MSISNYILKRLFQVLLIDYVIIKKNLLYLHLLLWTDLPDTLLSWVKERYFVSIDIWKDLETYLPGLFEKLLTEATYRD
jgi:hypothetical protein